jgi:preprotein translocase subunit SecE
LARDAREAPAEGTESGGYLREVWSELRKTVWPTGSELRQMTGVVIVTVVLLGAFLGALDFGLTALLAPLYTTTTAPAATPVPSTKATPTATASPTATPTVSPSPTS